MQRGLPEPELSEMLIQIMAASTNRNVNGGVPGMSQRSSIKQPIMDAPAKADRRIIL